MAQHIIVIDYDPCWEQQYLAEAKTIRAILGENCTAIFHIGSTAVRGLKAKPIIDIMPVVCSIAAVDEKQGAFEEIGYEYLGEFGMARRRYLRKGGDERTHQVHIFQETDRINIERHLAVRDFLRAHGEMARQYPYDIEGYCDGKEAFVKDLERQALRWKQKEPSSI
jgi:GrpB-like predicted nucleotidyltransferase (UPF0157 family)